MLPSSHAPRGPRLERTNHHVGHTTGLHKLGLAILTGPPHSNMEDQYGTIGHYERGETGIATRNKDASCLVMASWIQIGDAKPVLLVAH